MIHRIIATYKDGAFIPDEPCDIPDGTRAWLSFDDSLIPPSITDPEERQAVLARIFEMMRRNPIPKGAPRKFTREELHERR